MTSKNKIKTNGIINTMSLFLSYVVQPNKLPISNISDKKTDKEIVSTIVTTLLSIAFQLLIFEKPIKPRKKVPIVKPSTIVNGCTPNISVIPPMKPNEMNNPIQTNERRKDNTLLSYFIVLPLSY
jgi:hypothetical protein